MWQEGVWNNKKHDAAKPWLQLLRKQSLATGGTVKR